MTLIMGLPYKNKFVLMSYDTKVTEEMHDAYTYKKLDTPTKEVNLTHKKIERLTKNVLMATTGIKETGDIVEDEIKHLVTNEMFLEDCAAVLDDLIKSLWKQRKSYDEVGLEDKRALALNFIGTENFGCVLLGFFRNGNTGMVFVDPDAAKVEIAEDADDFHSFIISPSEDDNYNYNNWIRIRNKEEQILPNFMQQFILTHGKLSHKHKVSVSSDCNLAALIRNDDGEIELYEGVFDTNQLYSMFEQNPEVDYQTYYKYY